MVLIFFCVDFVTHTGYPDDTGCKCGSRSNNRNKCWKSSWGKSWGYKFTKLALILGNILTSFPSLWYLYFFQTEIESSFLLSSTILDLAIKTCISCLNFWWSLGVYYILIQVITLVYLHPIVVTLTYLPPLFETTVFEEEWLLANGILCCTS